MSKIKILSPNEICKIAAGEVVERPANIVKELVENALDANATSIEIYLYAAGKKAIRIIDNGIGMSAADAVICFEHHATSKISSVHDLDTLSSFGFRGEALSSIAAVSKVQLITCEKTATCGTKVDLQAGQLISQADIASPVGTDILISDLFYNVPARQKFLKKDETEWRHITQLFYAFVLDYKAVHFKLYHDDRLIYNCPPVDQLVDRVMQLWESQTAQAMRNLQATDQHDVTINGLISHHQLFRYNRNNIYFFVNRRLVQNYALSKALIKGYSNVLPVGRYPVAIIFIDLPQQQVDINVHPRKEEVSFLHPRRIEQLLTNTVKKVLEQEISQKIVSPSLFNQPLNLQPVREHMAVSAVPKKFHAAQFSRFNFEQFEPTAFPRSESKYHNSPDIADFDTSIELNQQIQATFIERDYEVIGQFKKTYLIVSNDTGLTLVDQHAAHERVLYERFKARFNEIITVQLLFPIIMPLSQADLATLRPHLDLLKEYGIGAELFGEDQLLIQSTPTYLKQVKIQELIEQLIGWINDYQGLDLAQFTKLINERMHAQMACKAAIKAGDILNNDQMYELLDDLKKADNRLTCPHGRPTIWSFSLDEIEKKFKRKL